MLLQRWLCVQSLIRLVRSPCSPTCPLATCYPTFVTLHIASAPLVHIPLPGNMEEYWQAFSRHPSLVGGFIWDWVDQCLVAKTSAGMPEGEEVGQEQSDGACQSCDKENILKRFPV